MYVIGLSSSESFGSRRRHVDDPSIASAVELRLSRRRSNSPGSIQPSFSASRSIDLEADVVPGADVFATGIAETDDELHSCQLSVASRQ